MNSVFITDSGTMLSNRSGSVAVTFGLAATILMACVGGAVDFNRWHAAQRMTSDSVDAAVLAGARALQLNPANHQAAVDTATAFFQRNIAGKTELSTNTVTFVTSDQHQAITATGVAKINSTLLHVVGISEMTVMSEAGSGFPKAKLLFGGQGGSNLEISLMLDVTGSMCNNGEGPCTTGTKIEGLKVAATRLVDMVVPATQNNYYSKMAIVPFSTRVRVGPDGGGGGMMQALTNLAPTWSGWYNECTQSSGGGGSEGSGNWQCQQYASTYKTAWKVMPCVTDRYFNSGNVLDVTENEAGSNKWLNAHGGDRMTRSWDSANTAATSQKGNTSSDPADNWNYNWNGSCADVANANEIMPLTTDPAALKARINGLEAYGATSGALGTAWAGRCCARSRS